MKLTFVASVAWLVASVAMTASAVEPSKDSWPQWGGIQRDHKSQSVDLKQSWPADGPTLVWKFSKAGMGYSSLAVSEGRGYSLGEEGGKNFIYCIDVNKGSELWRTEIGSAPPEKSYNMNWGGGPRSTPTVIDTRVIILDDAGTCASFNKADGKLQWKVNLITDLGGEMPKWGYSESPLVDGKRVVVCPGKANFLVALDLETGKTVMSSKGYDQTAHYVSVQKHNVDGVDCYTTASGKGLVSFAVDDGRLLWTNEATGASTATIPTPIIKGNYVYHTAGYGMGCVLVKLSSKDKKSVTAEQIYANKDQMNHHGGVVLVGDKVYGYKSKGGWVVQDFMTGMVTFQERVKDESGASVAYADGRIYVYGESTGNCYLIEPKDSWEVKGTLKLPEQTKINRKQGHIWAHPVIAEGKLFLRDLDLIFAFDIKK